jgi:hypothetical protein
MVGQEISFPEREEGVSGERTSNFINENFKAKTNRRQLMHMGRGDAARPV